jgi:hypothetical protein
MEARQNGLQDSSEFFLDECGEFMIRLLLILMFLGAAVGCSETMVSKDEVRVNEQDEVSVNDGPLYPELSCRDMEGEAKTSVDRRIVFENVSFSRGPWVRNVEYFVTPECVLTRDNIKPDPIGGRKVRFNLRYGSSDDQGEISVFKIEDYRNAFARYPQYIENRDAELRSLIADPSNLKTYGLEPPPHVTWMDASEIFYAKAAKLNFINGKGLLTVTAITQDSFVTVSNSRLRFLFQGFTADGKYFVEMNFPAKLKGLPEEDDEFPSSIGAAGMVFNSAEHQAAYDRYLLETAARIDKAPSVDFRPDIRQVEEFVRGFEIRTNE